MEGPRDERLQGFLGEHQEMQGVEQRGLLDFKLLALAFHVVTDTPSSLQSCSFTTAEDQLCLPTSGGNERQRQGEGALGPACWGRPARDPRGNQGSCSWDNPPRGHPNMFQHPSLPRAAR